MNLKAFIENRILEQLAEDENPIETTRNSFSSLLNERKTSKNNNRVQTDHLDEMKTKGWIVVNTDTNEPSRNSFTGQVLIYSDEKSAKAALNSMTTSTRRKHVVEPNFDVWESSSNVSESYVEDMKEAKDDYQIYHKTFSSAVQHAIQQVEKRGYEVDEEDWDRKVALGPRKPSSGKTNSYTIDLMKNGKETKRKLQMQVYYDEGRYELNMYIS